ncbi:hypothetical protein B566_EDAN011919, partial [Ephemera danica]
FDRQWRTFGKPESDVPPNKTGVQEKSEFRRNPLNPNFANAETIPTPRGKRLLCSNWWGWVRHPNYVGDMCMHLCWGLVADYFYRMSGKSFAAGRTVVAVLPEFDRPLSAKIIYENKSGTYRVLLDDGSKVTIPREDVFETLGDYEDAMQSPRKKSPGRAKPRGRSPGRARPKSKSPARKKSPGRKTATPKSPKVEVAKPVVTSPRRRTAAVKAEVQLKETPTMSLRLRRWDGTPPVKTKVEDVVDSDGEGARVSPAKATMATKKVQTEFCGAFGVISMFVLFVGILLTCQLLLRSANQSVAGLKLNQTDLILTKVKASLEVRRFDVVALFKGFPKFDLLAAEIFFGFLISQALLSMLPIGPVVPAIPGVQGPSSYRCNGLHPIPWILPVSTILLLLHRAHRDNARCKTKYGEAWARYCEKVPYACIPKVY